MVTLVTLWARAIGQEETRDEAELGRSNVGVVVAPSLKKEIWGVLLLCTASTRTASQVHSSVHHYPDA